MERTNNLSREILYKMDTLGCLALQKMIFVKPDKLAWGDLGFSQSSWMPPKTKTATKTPQVSSGVCLCVEGQ